MIRTNLTILTVLVSTCWCFLRHVRFLSRVGLKLRITLVFRVVANDFLHSMSVTRLNLVATQSKVSKIHVNKRKFNVYCTRAHGCCTDQRYTMCLSRGWGGGGSRSFKFIVARQSGERILFQVVSNLPPVSIVMPYDFRVWNTWPRSHTTSLDIVQPSRNHPRQETADLTHLPNL